MQASRFRCGAAGAAGRGGALLRDPQLPILDESCGGLDALTEARMIEAIFEWLGGRSLLLTKSQAGLHGMDETLVLEWGCVIERGRHAELLR